MAMASFLAVRQCGMRGVGEAKARRGRCPYASPIPPLVRCCCGPLERDPLRNRRRPSRLQPFVMRAAERAVLRFTRGGFFGGSETPLGSRGG